MAFKSGISMYYQRRPQILNLDRAKAPRLIDRKRPSIVIRDRFQSVNRGSFRVGPNSKVEAEVGINPT